MVIQRWQTLMLLISTVLMALFLALPHCGARVIEAMPLFIVGLLSGFFSLVAIFSFKHLNLQLRLTLLALLFAAVALVVALLLKIYFAALWLVPVLVLDVWARCRIKADQNLLKSYDRLR